MKKKKWILLQGLFVICFLLLPSGAFPESGIQWKNYDKALVLAKENNKKTFLYFYADWCTYCRKVENSVFTDEEIVRYLNSHFISAQVNGDNRKEVVSDYDIRGYPTFWFLGEDSSKLNYLPGYVSKDQFLMVLKYIKTDSYKDMEFNEFAESR